MSTQYHRRDARAALVLYLDVIDVDSAKLLGHLGDISAHGMMFLSTEPIAINQLKNVLIEVPEMGNVTAQTLHMRIETMWCKPNINPEWHCIGCRFVEIDADLLPVIEQISKNLSFGSEVEVTRVAYD